MTDAGTIEKTCSILATLIRGAAHDRNTIVAEFGVTAATADRYIRHLVIVPGVVSEKQGRRRTIKFQFWAATRAAGV